MKIYFIYGTLYASFSKKWLTGIKKYDYNNFKEFKMKKTIISVLLLSFIAVFVIGCSAQKSTSSKFLGIGMGVIGIVDNGKIQFYEQDRNGSWETDPDNDFILPKSYSSLFSPGLGVIGVVNNGKIQFYEQDKNDSWKTDPDNDFILPKGYSSLFSPGLGVIGVVDNGKIQFYEQDRNDTWKTDPDNDFILPK